MNTGGGGVQVPSLPRKAFDTERNLDAKMQRFTNPTPLKSRVTDRDVRDNAGKVTVDCLIDSHVF